MIKNKLEIRHQDHLFELNDTTVILVLDVGSLEWRPYWIPGHVNSECIFKCTSEWIILKNMELDTKITLLSSIIPRSYLFLTLALLGGGHNGFKVM